MKLDYMTLTARGNNWTENRGQASFHPDSEGVEKQVVNLYPEREYQIFEGFGGAITDAAGYVYSLMNPEQKRQVIQTYFSPQNMGYRLARVHMDSCDFCTQMYEAMSDPRDWALDSFSFARTEKYILPMLADAQAAAGRPLKLMLSPWSPPAFMKTNGSRVRGGSLKPECRAFWADYICRYIREFQERGYEVQRVSVQNEPKAVQAWDSCLFTAEEERVFLRDYLHPALARQGLGNVEIFIWDHNKERLYERARDTMDDSVRDLVAGAAFHWYSGDHFETLDLVREDYPWLKLIASESCIEYCFHDAADQSGNSMKLAHEIIGDLNHGANAFYDWNLLLDETGGPNHAGNLCHAAFLYDTARGKLLPQMLQRLYACFSGAVVPGSARIGLSKYTRALEAVAFRRPDGCLAVFLFNAGTAVLPVKLRLGAALAELAIPGQSIFRAIIQS